MSVTKEQKKYAPHREGARNPGESLSKKTLRTKSEPSRFNTNPYCAAHRPTAAANKVLQLVKSCAAALFYGGRHQLQNQSGVRPMTSHWFDSTSRTLAANLDEEHACALMATRTEIRTETCPHRSQSVPRLPDCIHVKPVQRSSL